MSTCLYIGIYLYMPIYAYICLYMPIYAYMYNIYFTTAATHATKGTVGLYN